jgi:SAM-dependent methyltransferase
MSLKNKLYSFALEVYFHIRPMRIKELFIGTKSWEDYWVRRKRGDDWNRKGHDWVKGYWESTKHPHRRLVVDAISRFEPKSVLEIGCASAPNLRLLAEKYPKAEIWGVDINRKAVEYGNKMFRKNGFKNVTLMVAQADKLLFAERTFDVVLTDAMLIYIGKDKIMDVMSKLIEIAKKGLVLVERHIEGVGSLGVYKDGLWQRDYIELIERFVPDAVITPKKITPKVWKEWSETGYVIEVRL